MGFMLHHGVLLLYLVRVLGHVQAAHSEPAGSTINIIRSTCVWRAHGKQSNYYYMLLGQAELFADRPLKLPIGIHAKYAIWVCLV